MTKNRYKPCFEVNNKELQPFIIVANYTEVERVPCNLRQDGLVAVLKGNDYVQYQLRLGHNSNDLCDNENWVPIGEGGIDLSGFVSLDRSETVAGEKNFMDKTFIQNQTFNSDNNYAERRMLLGSDKPGFIGSEQDALISGFNVFPKLNSRFEESSTNYYRGYIGVGVDIFKDFVGNTDYRPSHPAHDSLVGYGRRLGSGFKDGTNVTLVGTDILDANSIEVADCVTIVGKGVHNHRIENTGKSLSGFNFKNMMSGVTALGHEIWTGGIHSSLIAGSSIKAFSYIYNSLIVGTEIQNYSSVKYPTEEYIVALDNDMIIGNGLFKDPKKHAASHNLIVGINRSYNNEGWNVNYVPLIEGNFKNPFLRINGDFIVTPQNENNFTSGVLNFNLSLVQIPPSASGKVQYDPATKILTFSNAPAGRYTLASLIPKGSYNFTAIASSMSAAYNMRILDYIYDGGTVGFQYKDIHCKSNGTSPTNEFAIELTADTTGSILCELKYKDVAKTLLPSIKITDNTTANTSLFEVRATYRNSNNLFIGVNSATNSTFYKNSVSLGNDIMTNGGVFNDGVIIGQNTGSVLEAFDRSILVGSQVGNLGLETVNTTVIVGQGNLNKAPRITRSVLLGYGVLASYLGTNYTEADAGFNLIAIGASSGNGVEQGQSNILIGRNAGVGAKTINNCIAIQPLNTFRSFGTGDTFVNSIIISGENIAGNGSNTTTIGGPSTTKTVLYGTVESPTGFKITSAREADNEVLTATGSKRFVRTDQNELIGASGDALNSTDLDLTIDCDSGVVSLHSRSKNLFVHIGVDFTLDSRDYTFSTGRLVLKTLSTSEKNILSSVGVSIANFNRAIPIRDATGKMITMGHIELNIELGITSDVYSIVLNYDGRVIPLDTVTMLVTESYIVPKVVNF